MKVKAQSLFAVSLCLVMAACGGKKVKPTEGNNLPDGTMPSSEPTDGHSDNGRAGGLRTINFAYDNFSLTPSARDILNENATILKNNGSWQIQIEGHCDERGGIQYNIALGDKRANAVKKFLTGQGVPSNRIQTISFGKERPLVDGANEDAYAQNRRANFVVTSK